MAAYKVGIYGGNRQMKYITISDVSAFAIGFIVASFIIIVSLSNGGYIEQAKRLKSECEKDLTREFQCEMRFVKPEVNHEPS